MLGGNCMNYIKGKERDQLRIESIESYVDEDNEVRVIDKIIDYIDIESLDLPLVKIQLLAEHLIIQGIY